MFILHDFESHFSLSLVFKIVHIHLDCDFKFKKTKSNRLRLAYAQNDKNPSHLERSERSHEILHCLKRFFGFHPQNDSKPKSY